MCTAILLQETFGLMQQEAELSIAKTAENIKTQLQRLVVALSSELKCDCTLVSAPKKIELAHV
jgi:hypothetical protein